MTTYEYNGHKVVLESTEYVYGGLAVMMMCEGDYGLEPYAHVTRWITTIPEGTAFVDENNLPGIGKWLSDNELAFDTGLVCPSGYPLYRFTGKFFDTAMN